jgi:hypothetical protein
MLLSLPHHTPCGTTKPIIEVKSEVGETEHIEYG